MQMQVYDVKLVFFDLDDSLINKDANSLWIKWRFRHEHWALVEATQALASLYHAYKRGTVTHWRLSQYYRTRTRGMTPSEYDNMVRQFFREQGYLHMYRQAPSLIFAYRRRNIDLVMITGADESVARVYAEAFGIEHVISNRLRIDGERITGLEHPLCYGAGKVGLAEAFLAERGLTFEDCAFYTDSHADLPLLERVRQPVVLNPNALLREAAKERGWPILDWRGDDEG
ncbi:MAG: HAD-IB family hydrolase [Oceanobacter sp.]